MQLGGRVEVVSLDLEAGQTVDVVVLHESTDQVRSIEEILNGDPDHRRFRTAKEVDEYLSE